MNDKETQPSYFKSNWFKIILTIFLAILLVLLFYKIINMNLELKVTDFLSITLALFSIGLSAAFYFKSTEQSNKFYDDTVKFTRDIGTTLGRIQSGFGQTLKHLEKGNTKLHDKIEGLANNISQKQNRIVENTEVVQTLQELQPFLNDMKDNLDKGQEEEYQKHIQKLKSLVITKEKEIMNLQDEVSKLSDVKENIITNVGVTPYGCYACKQIIPLTEKYIEENSIHTLNGIKVPCPDCGTLMLEQ
ncbi:hypothetical protein QRE63_18795 [Bacillus mycoides]|uniref:hypothetical protein n=1 Tax=Bacillus TaxID=1386 RepID=UPI0018C3E37C|nr:MULTISPECIES: hypothetical protein [Bacillus]MBG0968239.1 hypothetical protein [Bacillus sp. SRB3LM]MBG0972900.1 hypothetical protein [Bacillus sp. SRB3LM]WJE62692.1 hypothetical protein QRE63_18795 [Bacillus mycoides]